MSEREESENVLFHFSAGDRVDAAHQEAHYAWVAERLEVELPGRLQYFKYRDRRHLSALTGRSTNGFAVPERLEVHAVFPWDPHEAVHVYSALVGRPSDFFNEGLAVAWAVDPLAGRLTGSYSGEPVHDWARRNAELLLPIESIVVTGAFRNVEEAIGYQEAGSFVEYLVETHGDAPLRQLFRRSGRDDDLGAIRAAFLASFGITLNRAESDWRAFLEGVV